MINRDEEKFCRDMLRAVTRTTGQDAIMKIRCSTGLTVESYNGNFYSSSGGSDIEIAGITSDSTFIVNLKVFLSLSYLIYSSLILPIA